MDYKEKYQKALERAKMILCNLPEGSSSTRNIETIFPELKESEDERIRKDLIKYLESDRDCQPCQDISFYDSSIAWLEKQEAAKTPQWMIDFLNDIRTASINKEGYDDYDGRREYEGKVLAIIRWLEGNFIQQKEQKPTIESKRLANEDEKIHKAIIEFFESQPDNTTYSSVSKRDILVLLKRI